MNENSPGTAEGRIELRVRYADTDSGGVVYHANYLLYFEQGRTELMRELGIPYRQLEENDGVILAVVDAQLRFRKPARYDDLLTIETRIVALSGARITFEYRARLSGEGPVLCEATTVLGGMDAQSGRPRRLPGCLKDLVPSAPFSSDPAPPGD